MVNFWLSFCLSWALVTPLVFAKDSLRIRIEGLIPSELSSLSSLQMRVDLEKKFATKIFKKDDRDALYLKYFEEKNDVTLGFKKNRLDYIYIEIPSSVLKKNPNLYNEILEQLSSTQKENIAKINQNDSSHSAGRYIIMDIPEEKMKLEFYNNEKKELRSIVLYSKK